MVERTNKLQRLLRILTLVHGERGLNAARLAERCGVTERTIYRDIKDLQAAQIPLDQDELTGGYIVRREFFMPPVDFTMEEALALVALGRSVGQAEQIPFFGSTARAVEKLRSQLPDALLADLDELDPQVHIQLAAGQSADGLDRVYARVRQAIISKRQLRCSYESAQAQDVPASGPEIFHFEPYALFYSQRAWYAVGRHEKRAALRCLKLNRFTRCELTDLPYAIPEDFTLKAHLGNAWRMIRGEQRFAVHLLFDRTFAETIADTCWHHTQRIDWREDGAIDFHCEVDGLEEIVWWVLSMGRHCQVIAPRELAEAVAEEAQAMMEQAMGSLRGSRFGPQGGG